MARAEVVDREAHARNAQQLHVARGELRIAHDGAFRDLEHEQGRWDAVPLQQLHDLIAQRGVQDVRRRQIHRQLDFESLPLPFAHLADRGLQHPARQLAGVAGLLCERHELPGRHVPELRVRPAHQSLEALHGTRRHGDLRLIDERQVVAGDGRAQVGDQREPAPVGLIRARAVGGHSRTRIARVLERYLHAAQQLIDGGAVLWMHAYRGRHVQLQGHSRQMEPGADDAGELVCIQHGPLERAILRDDEKLALGDACDQVDRGRILAQAAGGLAQHVIAHVMTEGAVDLPQIAHVEQQQSRRHAWLHRAHQLLEPTLRHREVRQPADCVVVDLVGDVGLAFRDRSLHRVERSGEAAELFAAGGLDRDFVPALLDAVSRFHELADGTGRAPAQHRADEGCKHEGDAIDDEQGIADVAVRSEHGFHRLLQGHVDGVAT